MMDPSPSPPSAPATKRQLRRGEVNHAAGFLGIPQSGKSALMLRRALELASEHEAYIIVHDAERQVPARLPPALGGWDTRVVRFDTVEAANAWLMREGRRALGRVVAVSCLDAVPVVEWAHRVAAASLAPTRGGEGPAPHVVLVIDEVANCSEMGANYLGPTLKAALVLRRHRHTALLWSTQTPDLVYREFLSARTELYVFRLESDEALKRLQKFAGMSSEALQRVKTLKQYEYMRSAPEGFKAPL